jgi:hypothetical protein
MAPTVSDVQKEKQMKQLLKMASFLLRNKSAVSNWSLEYMFLSKSHWPRVVLIGP